MEPNPFEDLNLPYLPDDLEVPRRRSDEQKATAFGDLLPLIDAYHDFWSVDPEYGLWEVPREPALLVGILRLGTIEFEEIVDLSGFPSSFAWSATFVPDRAAAQRTIAAIVEQFREGFGRLATMAPHGPELKQPSR